jgi:putative nucleotidyltransferase with HDIG domain/PAS domain S-box-containing protein
MTFTALDMLFASPTVAEAPLGVFCKDLQSRYIMCNRAFARMAGFSDVSDVIGKSDADMPWQDKADLVRSEDMQIITSAKAIRSERELNLTTGVARFFEVMKYPLRDGAGAIAGVTGYFTDVTPLHDSEDQRKTLDRANHLLMRCNSHIVKARDEQQLLEDICSFFLEGGYRMAWFGDAEQGGDKWIKPRAQAGAHAGYVDSIRISWADNAFGQGPTGMAVRERRSIVNQNFLTNPRMALWRELALRQGFQSSIALPVMDNNTVLGVLNIYAQEPEAFGEDEVALLESLTDNLAIGLIALRERRHATEALEQAVAAIAATIEIRDPYTAGHEERVGNLCMAIAERLKMSRYRQDGLRLAAVLHDIGKIKVPIEILTTPRPLTGPELGLIRLHPDVGYEIIRHIDFPWPVADIVRQHHERLDGSGYPQGLKGDQILLEARILAVADVVDAIASERPYRPARGVEAARAELREQSGVLYDTEVVNACLEVLETGDWTV